MDQDNQAAYLAASKLDIIKQAKKAADMQEYQKLYYDLIYPFHKLCEGMLSHYNSKTRFFLLYGESFCHNHFSRLFERYEGSACSSDKAGHLVHMCILASIHEGNIGLESELTNDHFWIPKKILRTIKEVIALGDAVISLYYGNPQDYITIINELEECYGSQTKNNS